MYIQRNFRHVLVATAFVSLSVLALSAPAPEAIAEQVEEDRPILEEIIVTAMKREQSLQDVPASIRAITSDTIDDSGLTGIQGLAHMAPGLIFAETIGRQTTAPSIRGVAPFGFADPTVVVMIDGYTSGFQRSGNNATLLDLERIEILRGPQATLYGRNAIGGVINYITRKPDNELRANLRFDAGSYGTYVGQASLGGPLVNDLLHAGIAFGYRESGGFLDNVATEESNVNDEQDINGRFNLRFTPGDAVDINFTLDYNEADDAAGDPSHVFPDIYFSGSPPNVADIVQGRVDFNDFDRTIDQRNLGGFDRDETTGVLHIDWDLGFATLSSITGDSNQETSVRVPFNRHSSSAFDFDVQWDVESFSQELRLASSDEGTLQWLIGGYYYDNQRQRNLYLDFGGGPLLFQQSLDEVENWALFANAEFQVSDRVTLTAGIRYDNEDRKQSDLIGGGDASSSNEEWLPSVSISYAPNENMSIYGTISRGYHAGGPNEIGSIAAGAPAQFDPEFLTNYEIGVKGSSPHVALSYEIAAFFMDWDDQQIFTAFDAFNRFIINAGKSEIWGLEAFLRFDPVAGLSLTGSVSILDAEYKDFFNPIDAEPFGLDPQLGGNDLLYSADFAASFSAQYITPISEGGVNLRLRAEVNHVGDRPFDATNVFIGESYTVVNLYAGAETERWEAGVFANNALDEKYINGGFAFADLTFPALATIGDPSVYGVRLSLRY